MNRQLHVEDRRWAAETKTRRLGPRIFVTEHEFLGRSAAPPLGPTGTILHRRATGRERGPRKGIRNDTLRGKAVFPGGRFRSAPPVPRVLKIGAERSGRTKWPGWDRRRPCVGGPELSVWTRGPPRGRRLYLPFRQKTLFNYQDVLPATWEAFEFRERARSPPCRRGRRRETRARSLRYAALRTIWDQLMVESKSGRRRFRNDSGVARFANRSGLDGWRPIGIYGVMGVFAVGGAGRHADRRSRMALGRGPREC